MKNTTRHLFRRAKIRWTLAILSATGILGGTAVIAPNLKKQQSNPNVARSLVPTEEGLRSTESSQVAAAPSLAAPSAAAPSPVASPTSENRIASPLGSMVRIYFATDRQLIDPSGYELWIRILGPTAIGLSICGVMLFFLMQKKERMVWGIGLSIGGLATLYFGYEALIYGQQAWRLRANQSVMFGSRRYDEPSTYPLHLGTAQVSFPPGHVPGRIEQPQIYRLEFREDADKHVMLRKIDLLAETEYFRAIRNHAGENESADAFVFIHGYNVDFEEALRRTAQIAKDLDFQGVPILYSWPSRGKLASYRKDEADVAWTANHLEGFLRDLKQRGGVKTLHLVAHSMGNRAMLRAIERLTHGGVGEISFGQIVMAAPDVDASEFRGQYSDLVSKSCQQVTLYTSASDRALLASKQVHGYPRLGLTEGEPPIFNGIDTIEVSEIDTSMLGHSYYGDMPLLLHDMKAIVELGYPAKKRNWLERISQRPTSTAWRFGSQWLRTARRIEAESSL